MQRGRCTGGGGGGEGGKGENMHVNVVHLSTSVYECEKSMYRRQKNDFNTNTIQHKYEYYYSGVYPIEFGGHL